MLFRNMFDRFGRKDPAVPADPALTGNDGWVEFTAGRLIVHDPIGGGKYATLTPEGSVRLFINDEEVREATAVTAEDRIRFDLPPEGEPFVEIAVAEDGMTAVINLTADPFLIPDTVSALGRNHVLLQPGYSPRARQRVISPRQVVLDGLAARGVVFGIDEAAIERALSARADEPVVVARGQEARPPVQGRWVWRLDELSLVEAGQVIAEYSGEQTNQLRITVLGQETSLYAEVPRPHGYLAGNGTRVIQGVRLVASAGGRARAVAMPQGNRVHIFPVQLVEGDQTENLEAQADVIVKGSIRDATVTSPGEILVIGHVEKSTLRAEVITVLGTVTESQLQTLAPGHPAPLRAELGWLLQRLEAMRESIHQQKPVSEEAFRIVSGSVRGLRRRAEQMGINHPEFQAASDELAKVFMGTLSVGSVDLPTAGRLLMSLGKAIRTAEQAAQVARNVRATALENAVVWAGRDIIVDRSVMDSQLFAGAAIQAGPGTTVTHSELVAGAGMQLGILTGSRGSGPVIIRSAAQAEVEEAQMGTTFEFGAERKVFERDQRRIAVSINAKGQMIFREMEG